MLSLDNALDEAELRAFDARVRELLAGAPFRYVAELKMDGLSMAARYREGSFAQAITRGDGNDRRRRDRKRANHTVPPFTRSRTTPSLSKCAAKS